MYSNKLNVNILTALLVKHGIRHAVVCPGSRNAPIVHNLNECPDIACYPVTDERSAGFYALGMSQKLDEPVVVCVTSGTALLNLLPAVAEAYYQHVRLVVVSADRPQQWIDQLDGQTLQQPGALSRWVTKSVQLPEPQNDAERWYCNRLVNEALLDAQGDRHPCVHINVPVTEPLFGFDVPQLPEVRVIRRFTPSTDYDCLPQDLVEGLINAERPMIVFGQMSPHRFVGEGVDFLFSHVIVLHEALAAFPSVSHFDEVLHAFGDELSAPDFVLYVGDAIVSKRLKAFLRSSVDAQVWRVTPTGDVEDTFMNLTGIVAGDAEFVLESLSNKVKNSRLRGITYRRQWLRLLQKAREHALHYVPAYSQMAVVRDFERQLLAATTSQELPMPNVHYANSSAVRLANIYARHYVGCNRGVNGIEGSLSTAAGCSLVTDALVFCVIGDLSFFYDQNALWNQNLRGNLRILLLNNGKGGIFDQLRGLEQSPARDRLVAGQHQTSAEGICRQNRITYLSASNEAEMQRGIARLLTADAPRPMLLEVFTDATTDAAVFRDYYQQL